MKALPLVAALFSAAGLGLWLGTAPPSAVIGVARDSMARDNQPMTVAQIIPVLEKLHGAKFVRTPAIIPVSLDGLREIIRRHHTRDFPPDIADARQRAAMVMGLTRVPFDWVDSMTGIAMETAACHYDPPANSLYVHEAPAAGASPSVVLEVARALILQTTSLRQTATFDHLNDDASLAAECVLQDAARQLQNRYYFAHPENPSTPSPLSAPVNYYAAPPWLRSRLLFPASMAAGFHKAEAAIRPVPEGHEDMLSGLFSSPPRSSAEAMHPDLYQNSPAPAPAEIRLPSAAGNGLALIFDNVMGEFGTLQVLKAYLTQERANSAAAGWRGDRYLIFSDPTGSNDAAIWQTGWTTETEAADFLAAVHEWILARFSLTPKTSYLQPGGGLLIEETTAACRIALIPDSCSVRLLFSADPTLMRQLSPHFFP